MRTVYRKTRNTGIRAGLTFVFLYLAVIVALAIGWVLNIMKLFDVGPMAAWTFVEVLRIIGIFLAPLGGLMGWF